MSAIRLVDLTKDYVAGFWRTRRIRALDGVTFEVSSGEVFGLLGPNGSGKTTTLKLLMHLAHPTRGYAEILGRPSGDVETRRRVGYLPETPYFYEYLTAEELLSYFASLFGYPAAERRRRVARCLDEAGIEHDRTLSLRKLSKGMLQRVGLAQALLNDPDVLFLDEPMSGLDPLGRRHVRSLILRLRDAGRTVFFSSHILADAEALCSRVAILARGRLVMSGHVSDLLGLEIRGWELVVSGVDEGLLRRVRANGGRATPITDARYAIELPADAVPEAFVQAVAACGGRVVSLNPVRETLEDLFVRKVQHRHEGAVTQAGSTLPSGP